MNKMRIALLALAIVFILSTATSGLRAVSKTRSQAPSSSAPNKRALLVGINKYKYSNVIPTLSGSINDVEDMKALLIGKFGFPPENVQVLTDEKATHAGIVSAIESHLINKTQPGDIVVFHYSGHGSQMKDATGQSPNGLDETLVPYDSRDPEKKVFDISGSELKPILRRLAEKTKNITFILDSCHSGTLVKAAHAIRMIPPDDRQPPPARRSPDAGKGLGSFNPGVQNGFLYSFIAAASSKEVAFEHPVDGKQRGALTYFLTRALRNAPAGATYRDIMDAVMGNVTLNYPTQHPQLEGLQADQHVFGDTDSLAQTYVLASPAPNGRVSLEAGQVFGVTVGSIFEVFAPGTKKFDGPSLAKIQVTEVTPFASSARIVSGSAVQNFSRAIEREHNYGGLQLLLYFDPGSDSAQVRSLKTAVSAYKHVQVVADPNLAHLLIKRDGNSIVTLGADQTPYSPPLALNDPELASRFKNQIEQWARWFNVLSIRNLNPAINATVQIKTKKDGATKDPFARVDSSGPTVFVDETVEVTVTNKSSKDLYFALLDLQTDGSITTIYPPRGSHQVLTAQSSFTKSFTTFLPDQKKEVIDVVMLLASVRQFDPEVVAGPAVKDAAIPSDPIGRLLAFARGLRPDEPGQRPNSPTPPVTAGASTGVTAGASTGPLAVDQWVTDQKVLKVRAR